MTERIRVACCDAAGTVIDLVVVEDFLEWAKGATATIEARWTGGVYALADRAPEASVGIGWTRSAKGAWSPPVTPREERIDAINAQTSARVAAGFAFRGATLSLSVVSQINITNAFLLRDSLPYPIQWPNADDSGFVEVGSAKDVEELYGAATTTVLLARVDGNAKKSTVLADEAAKAVP